ncbi:MAG: hypothetical protein Q9168_004037 [Polycauliona sp. 1 TL-2023]
MGLIDCTPELVLMMLEYLEKDDIKHVRLTCKILENISVGMLFHRLHVSPHEKDMGVFDAITQRPEFRSTVKVISFDTARFMPNPTVESYVAALSTQLNSGEYSHLRATDAAVRRMAERMDGQEMGQRDANFKYGFRDYFFMARERSNLNSQAWFARVLRGLKALGPIKAVSFENTFDTDYNPEVMEPPDESPGNIQPKACDQPELSSHSFYNYDSGNFEEIWCGENTEMRRDWKGWTKTITDALHEGGDVTSASAPSTNSFIRRRLQGSPSARSWPLFNLQPTDPTLDPRNDASSTALTSKGSLTDGSTELIRALQLLKLSNNAPKEFVADGYRWSNQDLKYGLPTHPFATPSWSDNTLFTDVCRNLVFLELQFASYADGTRAPQRQVLHQLQEFLQSNPPLQLLKLVLPDDEPLHRYEDIFPQTTNWRIDRLKSLYIHCLEISYHDLFNLLFDKFFYITILHFGKIRLLDGDWGSLMAGLRTRHWIKDAMFGCLEHAGRGDYYVGESQSPSIDESKAFTEALGNYVSRSSQRRKHDDLLKMDRYLSMPQFMDEWLNLFKQDIPWI